VEEWKQPASQPLYRLSDRITHLSISVIIESACGLKCCPADRDDDAGIECANLIADVRAAKPLLGCADWELVSLLRRKAKHRVRYLKEVRVQTQFVDHQIPREPARGISLRIPSQVAFVWIKCVIPIRSLKKKKSPVFPHLEPAEERSRTRLDERRDAFIHAKLTRHLSVDQVSPFDSEFSAHHRSTDTSSWFGIQNAER
jgi:hypothetical protein